jgi:hypothetical protein
MYLFQTTPSSGHSTLHRGVRYTLIKILNYKITLSFLYTSINAYYIEIYFKLLVQIIKRHILFERAVFKFFIFVSYNARVIVKLCDLEWYYVYHVLVYIICIKFHWSQSIGLGDKTLVPSHSFTHLDCHILGYDTAYSSRWMTTVQRYSLPLSSIPKIKAAGFSETSVTAPPPPHLRLSQSRRLEWKPSPRSKP